MTSRAESVPAACVTGPSCRDALRVRIVARAFALGRTRVRRIETFD